MKITYITPNPNDPLAMYRGSLPLAALRRHENVEYITPKQVDWSNIVESDLVFFQRPYTEEHIRVADICRKWNIKYVCDFDDWLFDLSQDNPAFHIYNNNPHHLSIAEGAEKIFVATEKMQQLYMEKQGLETVVVPNAYCTDTFKPRQVTGDYKKIVLWRGSNSHTQDLFSVRMGFVELIKKHKDWQFCFINCPPWFLGDKYDNVKTLSPYNCIDYMHTIGKLKPAIMTHPLHKCDFNESKSMCSWIEASHAGAAFVGPDFKEYNRNGITNYKADSSESFYKAIDGLITNPDQIPVNAAQGQSLITEQLSLREVNKTRLRAFVEVNNR